MVDFLAELFDQFDPEHQATIRAAEDSIEGILAQGAAAVRDRQLASGSTVLTDWVLEPGDDARADAAGVVFAAYVNALWRKTDAENYKCVQDFIATVDKLREPILTKYGWEGEALIDHLQSSCRTKALHKQPTADPGVFKDHPADDSERTAKSQTSRNTVGSDIVESAVSASGKPNEPDINGKHQDFLHFSIYWRAHNRGVAVLQAKYNRRLGRNGDGAVKQEVLLDDARDWAQAELRQIVPVVRDIVELKEQVVKHTWDEFVPSHKHYRFFELGYREFAAALWQEGSLEDHAIVAMAAKAAATGPAPSAAATKKPAADTAQAPESQTNVARNGVNEDGERAPAAPQSVKANDSPVPTDRGTTDEATQGEQQATPASVLGEATEATNKSAKASQPQARGAGKNTPRRTVDLKSIRERVELADALARELAIIKQETRAYCTVEGLKRKYPKFILWTVIEDSQIKDLTEGQAFSPRAYAENLMLAKYGLTSRETTKKYRQRLRQADKAE